MKWMKTFETFDFSQTLPVAQKSDLTFYYHCDDCDDNFREFNMELTNCPGCNSTNIEELSPEEWQVLSDLDVDDSGDEFIDLYNLKNKTN